MTPDRLVRDAAQRLSEAGSPSPRPDAEALWMHASGRDRTWLYTWGDLAWGKSAGERWQQARFDALIAARARGTPVAYLTGEREFWGLALATSPDTLIPRADTETLVQAALDRAGQSAGRLLDMGTGTGAVALAFASVRPGWDVLGVDVRREAVALARRNAERLKLHGARFIRSDWFSALGEAAAFDIIVANPPYIDPDDPHLAQGDVRFEPRSALVAKDHGRADLRYLIDHAGAYLTPDGWLALEHGYDQAFAVRTMLARAGYARVASVRDLGGHERVSLGQRPA